MRKLSVGLTAIILAGFNITPLGFPIDGSKQPNRAEELSHHVKYYPNHTRGMDRNVLEIKQYPFVPAAILPTGVPVDPLMIGVAPVVTLAGNQSPVQMEQRLTDQMASLRSDLGRLHEELKNLEPLNY